MFKQYYYKARKSMGIKSLMYTGKEYNHPLFKKAKRPSLIEDTDLQSIKHKLNTTDSYHEFKKKKRNLDYKGQRD